MRIKKDRHAFFSRMPSHRASQIVSLGSFVSTLNSYYCYCYSMGEIKTDMHFSAECRATGCPGYFRSVRPVATWSILVGAGTLWEQTKTDMQFSAECRATGRPRYSRSLRSVANWNLVGLAATLWEKWKTDMHFSVECRATGLPRYSRSDRSVAL